MEKELTTYIQKVTGGSPALKPLCQKALASIPLYLAHSFQVYEIQLFGHSIILAIPKQEDRSSLAELSKEREMLANGLHRDVVLVLSGLRSYERRRLVQKRVPFIVPGRQMFLPMMLVDLSETFSARAEAPSSHLGWVAQVILLRHLLRKDIVGRSLAEIAGVLGYSPMAITQGVEDLAGAHLCQGLRAGRTRTIRFEHEPKALWHAALPLLRSPVKRTHWLLDLDTRKLHPYAAGLTALSEVTQLAAPPKPIFAASAKQVRPALTGGLLAPTPLEDEATSQLQVWAYTPGALTAGPYVDTLSLYLSLKDEPDERIQMALQQLMEAWT